MTCDPAYRGLDKLNPAFRERVERWLAENPEIFVTETWRSEGRQACLVAEGVSWVKVSNHQLGRAVDIAFHGELYPSGMELWRKVADSAKKYGIDWGYDLWGTDKPHFQMTELNIDDLIVQNSQLWEKARKVYALADEIMNELHDINESLRNSKK